MNFLWDNFFRKDQKERTLYTILKENYLFQDLSEKDIRFVSDVIHVRNYRPGEVVFSQGEVGVGMYIIIKGSIDITMTELAESAHRAGGVYITRLSPGDFFGEIALVEENSRRSANAVAHNEVQLVGFYKSDLVEILQRNPTAGFQVVSRLAEVLGRRLRETTEKVSELRRQVMEIKGHSKLSEKK
ncbi:MAG: cyclic nucleotide-binding domain-containing protein [Pseudomonadota bacterium]|nr:cyclic nucleotide-binding domain-containing protein [Pseudomonadota bacterium]